MIPNFAHPKPGAPCPAFATWEIKNLNRSACTQARKPLASDERAAGPTAGGWDSILQQPTTFFPLSSVSLDDTLIR